MRRWWVVIALLLSLGVNAGILAMLGLEKLRAPIAPGAPGAQVLPPPELGPRPDFDRLADRLGVSGENRTRFIELQEHFLKGVRADRRDLQEERARLRHELLAGDPDAARLEEIVSRLVATQGRLERALIENVVATCKLLTPDQRAEFLRFLAQRLGPRLERPPGGGPPRPFGPGPLRPRPFRERMPRDRMPPPPRDPF